MLFIIPLNPPLEKGDLKALSLVGRPSLAALNWAGTEARPT
jgi:hypothetical protein